MTQRRGRPAGTGKNDDSALKAIATKMVTGMSYDQAVAVVYATHKPHFAHETKTIKDRWRRKWGQRSDELLAEANTPIVRYVEGPPADRLMLTRGEILQQHFNQNPAEQLKIVLEHTGLTLHQLQAQQAELARTLRDPAVRDALELIKSGQVHSALALARKFQS